MGVPVLAAADAGRDGCQRTNGGGAGDHSWTYIAWVGPVDSLLWATMEPRPQVTPWRVILMIFERTLLQLIVVVKINPNCTNTERCGGQSQNRFKNLGTCVWRRRFPFLTRRRP